MECKNCTRGKEFARGDTIVYTCESLYTINKLIENSDIAEEVRNLLETCPTIRRFLEILNNNTGEERPCTHTNVTNVHTEKTQ